MDEHGSCVMLAWRETEATLSCRPGEFATDSTHHSRCDVRELAPTPFAWPLNVAERPCSLACNDSQAEQGDLATVNANSLLSISKRNARNPDQLSSIRLRGHDFGFFVLFWKEVLRYVSVMIMMTPITIIILDLGKAPCYWCIWTCCFSR
jgi:hypothetical protein